MQVDFIRPLRQQTTNLTFSFILCNWNSLQFNERKLLKNLLQQCMVNCSFVPCITLPATYNSILNCSIHNDILQNSDVTMTSKLYWLIIYKPFACLSFNNISKLLFLMSIFLLYTLPFHWWLFHIQTICMSLDLPHTMNNIVLKKTIYSIIFYATSANQPTTLSQNCNIQFCTNRPDWCIYTPE